MRKLLALAAMPFMLAGSPAHAQLTGTLGIAENSCVLPIATFVGQICSYSGGANIAADIGTTMGWIGPLDSGGFYSSLGDTPGFTLSTQTGVSDDGVPLTSFLVGVGSSPGDGKVAPSLTGNLTMTGSTLSGSFTIGAGARVVSTGGASQGSKTAEESWTSIVHTIVATPGKAGGLAADFNLGANGFGGNDYVFGSVGFPPPLCTATDCFASETGALSGAPATTSPWAVATGGSGPQITNVFIPGGVDIVSYEVAASFVPKNVGVQTSATLSGWSCNDTGLDPKEPGTPADTVSDCVDSSVVWGSNKIDPVDDPDGAGGNPPVNPDRTNAAFDNLILKVSTDSSGNVVAVDGYYVVQYNIISPGYNSWVGGTLSFTQGVIPIPAAVWLFGSALGLLGWARRRVTA